MRCRALAASPIWILTCSECSCSVVANCFFLLPCVLAGVATSSMLMAITAQHALEQGYWSEGDFRRRVSRRGSVGKQVDELPPTFWCAISILIWKIRETPENWKVVDGLPLQGGSQLAVDTTLVSALRGDGSARAGAHRTDAVALIAAR